jgi:hypothetical protein
MQFSLQETETQLSFPQSAADEQEVSRPRAGPQNRLASVHFSHDGQARDKHGILRRVAPGQDQAEPVGCACQPVEETVEPRPGATVREPHGQEEASRSCAHGGNVTCGAGERFVTDSFWRVNFAEEVDIFKKRVRRDYPIRARSRAQNSGIIANTDAKDALTRRESPAHPFDQFLFPDHQDSCPKPLLCGPIGSILGHGGRSRYGRGFYFYADRLKSNLQSADTKRRTPGTWKMKYEHRD